MNQGKRTRAINTKECLGQRSKVRVLENSRATIQVHPGAGRFGISQLQEEWINYVIFTSVY